MGTLRVHSYHQLPLLGHRHLERQQPLPQRGSGGPHQVRTLLQSLPRPGQIHIGVYNLSMVG